MIPPPKKKNTFLKKKFCHKKSSLKTHYSKPKISSDKEDKKFTNTSIVSHI